jgi:hypothetical protein
VFEIEDRNLVEGIKSLHSSIEKLKSERAELRKRDIRSSELVERVHRHCEARGVIRKVGQCPVDAILTSHSDHVGMVEQLNECVEMLEGKNLSGHERHMCEMLLRKMRGQPVEVRGVNSEVFIPASTRAINTEREYRIPVKKLNIPWEYIKPEYKFAAMDEGGKVFVYALEPILAGTTSWHSASEWWGLAPLTIDTDGIDWRESLTKRPE